MSFFHLQVKSKQGEEIITDLSETQLRQTYLTRYEAGETLTLNGVTFDAAYIEKVTITRSDKSAKELAPSVKTRRRAEGYFTISGWPDEWYVAVDRKATDNVTNEFITGPPGNKAEAEADQRNPATTSPATLQRLVEKLADTAASGDSSEAALRLVTTALENVQAALPSKQDLVSWVPDARVRALALHDSVSDLTVPVTASTLLEIAAFAEALNRLLKPLVDGRKGGETSMAVDLRKVFVVHGRNKLTRDAMFRFLRAIGLEPIEWSQAVALTSKGSPYVGEVLDAAFDAAAAILVLLTPDDEAQLKEEFRNDAEPSHETQLTGQARPNVLFEAGMAMGRSQERTILVEIGELRPFSDVGGRHVIRMNNSPARRQELAQRLKAAGCSIDLTGTDWHSEGDF